MSVFTFENILKNNINKLDSLLNIFDKNKQFNTLTLRHNESIFTLPNEPLISTSLSKEIVSTPVKKCTYDKKTGKLKSNDFTVIKEYITTNDEKLIIRGVCVDLKNKNAYPGKQVEILLKLSKIDEPLQVVSNKFFALLGINQIVIKSLKIDEMQGQQGVQTYTIEAVSNSQFYTEIRDL